MDKLMHILRNPSGFSEEEIRNARIEICEIVEEFENALNHYADHDGWWQRVDTDGSVKGPHIIFSHEVKGSENGWIVAEEALKERK